ncbi:MAG: glycosyltransferase family 4 protein [Acidobacteriota bacterium]
MAERSPEIVFFNPWDRLIGPNRYLVELLRHAPELSQRSLIALPEGSGADEEYLEMGARVVAWPEVALVHPRISPRHLAHLVGAHTVGVARVRRRLRQLAPRLVVSNSESLWLGGMAARSLGIPHLQVVHTLTFEDRLGHRPRLLAAYLRFIASWNQRLLAVSQAVEQALVRHGVTPSQLATLPNPLPRELPPDNPQRAQELDALCDGHQPILVCAGRISPMKGQDRLIEALPRVRERFPDVLCCFAGRVGSPEGAEDTVGFSQRLRQRVSELGLEDAVRFLGECDVLPDLLRRATLYIQPSRTESFGRVVAEALLCETPVVAFEVGGVPETAGPGALLVEDGDIAGLSAAIIESLTHTDATRQRAAAGRQHVLSRFTGEDVARRFLGILEDLNLPPLS